MTVTTTVHERVIPGAIGSDAVKVIFASSLGAVFEWYDFYLYGSLATIISKQFFSGVNERPASSSPFSHSPPGSPSGPSERCSSAASETWSVANTPSSSRS
jgi:hypothetical protein